MPHASPANPPLPSPDAISDAQLVARARQGDAAAFEIIVRRNNRLLFRAARGVVADDADAQDVVQEAYLHAFTHLDTFRAEAALSTRSEERRVGEECVSTGISRWSPEI